MSGGVAAPRAQGRPLRSLELEVLESIYTHRLLTTSQLLQLHTPAGQTRDPTWMRHAVGALARRGLVDWACHRDGGRNRLRCWYVTQAGADSLEAVATDGFHRRVLVTPEGAAGIHQAHTLAVNEAGIAVAQAAKERGHECAWEHEVAHRIRDGKGKGGVQAGEVLVADAVLYYAAYVPEEACTSLLYYFLELDRATTTVQQLGEKLRRYVALSRYVPGGSKYGKPAWQDRYPALPTLCLVLAGKPRHLLQQRRHMLTGVTRLDPMLATIADRNQKFSVCAVLLEDLQQHGPWAAVFRFLDEPETPVTIAGVAPGEATQDAPA